MLPRGSTVLMDAVAIKAAHETRCWNALRKGYDLRSVPICVQEATQRDKHGRHLVDRTFDEIAAEIQLNEVSEKDILTVEMKLGLRTDLDDGEKHLLAYASTLDSEAWWLCGPDNGTVRALHYLGLIERMVSIEELGQQVGHRFQKLSHQYTENWLSSKRTNYLFGDLE